MPDDYEAVYTHPGGATAVFIRRDGSLDAVARGLDSEQFWVFKQVKSLLVRNEEDDLREATRLMAGIGFTAQVKRLEPALVPAGVAAPAAPAHEVIYEREPEHDGHPHAPAPSYWPLLLGLSASIGLLGLIVVNTMPWIAAIGLVLTFASMIGWGVEPFEI
ncbi:MAG TPA: cytochrome c oxidase subunit 4 [Ktedonobacterales bacterium]